MITLLAAFALAFCPTDDDKASKQAEIYAEAVDKLNAAHARNPKGTEAELAAKLPAKAAKALDKLIALEDSPGLLEGLVYVAEKALELDRIEDFNRAKERLARSEFREYDLGAAITRPRFQLRGRGVDEDYLEHFSEVFQAVLEGYDEVFGFEEFSKVPGKKLRVRIHLEEKIERPPHFAPQFEYHSEIDFPIVNADELVSPTSDGKFLFYGLCHELGHVIAMWGDRANEEDKHVWAHYTGVVVCEYVAEKHKKSRFMKGIRDERWRSYEAFEKEFEDVPPNTTSREGISALFRALHEEVGPKAIGDAINYLDEKDVRRRINKVRYYTFRELEDGLLETLKKKKRKKLVKNLFAGGT